jgi:hypothetical protein
LRKALTIAPVSDPAAVDSVLTDPFVADRLRHDGQEPGYVKHEALTYSGAFLNGELVGLILAIRHSEWEIEAHIAVKRSAILAARSFALEWLASAWLDPELMRVTVLPYASNRSAINFCAHLGFGVEGIRRRACKRGGVATDVIVMGMVREDFEMVLFRMTTPTATVH